MLFGSDNINDFGNRVQSCRMEGDSMQPTIEPCEVVAFVDCGGPCAHSWHLCLYDGCFQSPMSVH